MKTKILLSAFIFINLFVKAQVPNYQWVNQIGTGSVELVASKGLATDANANVFLTGQFNGPSLVLGTFTLTSGGSQNSYVVKYDVSGNVIWAKKVGGSVNVTSSGLALDGSGNVLVSGSFSGPSVVFGAFTLTNTQAGSGGFQDVFIIKYDPNGNVLWAKSCGGNKGDMSTGVAVDLAGNAYLTGYFSSTIMTIGVDTLTNLGPINTSDIFVVKYDPNGNVLWAKREGGTTNDLSRSIASDPSGNVLLTGYFGKPSIIFGSTTLTATGTSYTNLFVVKYDNAGNVLWAKGGNGTGQDEGRSITTDSAGNVMVTGSFYSSTIIFGTATLTSAGNGELFVVKYDSGGNVIWAKSGVGSSSGSIGLGIASDASGDVLVTGVFLGFVISFGTTTLTNTSVGDQDIFIVKYDAAGNVMWATGGGGSDNDAGNTIAVDANLDVLVAGAFKVS